MEIGACFRGVNTGGECDRVVCWGGTNDYHIMNHYFVGQFVIAHSLFAGRWHNARSLPFSCLFYNAETRKEIRLSLQFVCTDIATGHINLMIHVAARNSARACVYFCPNAPAQFLQNLFSSADFIAFGGCFDKTAIC